MNIVIKEIKEKAYFIPLLRLLDLVDENYKNKPSTEYYMRKLINALKDEGYVKDAQLVENVLKMFKGEPVAMAVMDKKGE